MSSSSFFTAAHDFVVHNSSFRNDTYVAGNLNYNVRHGQEDIAAGQGLAILRRDAVSRGASHYAEQRFPPPNCHPGTRSQILEILKKWITNDHKSTSIYWIYGAAGVGKSAVAQTIAETFVQHIVNGIPEGRLAASFFFSRVDASRNNLSLFFTTIAHQLATSPVLRPHLGAYIDLAIRHNPNILHETLERQFQELIVNPCAKLPPDTWKNLPRLIIIDGLDECVDIKSQERLLSIIRQSKTKTDPPFPFDFLMCSRPEPRIRNAFNHPDFYSILDRNDLGESFESGKDIASYLRDGFSRIQQNHESFSAHVEPDWPGDGIIQQLVQRACGQFIYAATVLKYIGDYRGLPTERLEIILKITVPDGFASPYPDLDLLYMQILSAVQDEDKDIFLDIMAHLLEPGALHPIFYGKKDAFSIEGLFFLPEGKAQTLFFGLHSVLDIPENDNDNITIRHASFVDFLTDRKRSGIYYVDIGREAKHERIALYLIKRLVYSIKNNDRLKYMNSKFDIFAWEFWIIRCRQVGSSPGSRLFAALEEFDLCELMKTPIRYTILEDYIPVLRQCINIADWKSSHPQLQRHISQYRLFKDGFRVQIPTSLQTRDRDEMKMAVSVLKYQLCLYQPNMWDVISVLMNRQLSPEHVGNVLCSSWPCPTILPLDPESQSNEMRSTVDAVVDVRFSECHKEITLQCLQIIRMESQHAKDSIIYAKDEWINHLLETTPSKETLSVLLRNLSLLQSSEDAEKALGWVEKSGHSRSRNKAIQALTKRTVKLVDVEERRKPHFKRYWFSCICM
ncbi:hypothetical protein F5890DRAFT_1504625 [Lentinula detonsa]|uniref:NACHT domain-containing protein n=1 Tax=Lentinula detonsa TaxID=2804962 RepID=A0AA38Q290_9AGAR|nr:hypothetical protein F5890DRAFT_1504625 [Lentinula detonsa]